MKFIQEKMNQGKSGSVILLVIMLLSLTFAWILELGFDIKPCSLCLLQRFGMYVSCLFLGVKLIIDYFIPFLNKVWLNKTLLVGSVLGLIGSLIAGLRQTYIQMLPEDKLPACGADLETLLTIVTPFEAVRKVFEGSGECADKALVVMGLSLANWATVLFAILLTYNICLLFKRNTK